MHKDAGLVADQITDTAHQRSTTGQHDAAINDVGSQFGRGALEGSLHRFNDHVEGLGDRFPQVTGFEVDGAGQSRQQVQPSYIHRLLIKGVIRERRANADLDVFRGALAHNHVVDLLEINADRITDLITGDAHGFTQHRATKAQHRHLRGATTNVDDHRADGFGDRQAGTDGSGHRLIDQMHLASAGHAGLTHGATLNAGDATGDTHHQTGRHDPSALIALGDEGLEHLLCCIEIGDHTVAKRPHGADVAGGPSQHQFGFVTHCQGGATLQIQCHHRGLLQHDAFT